MLMIAIIGAVICGIVMAVANAKSKQGATWGQPVAILFGILAIAFAGWAIFLNAFGKPEGQRIAEEWQQVRGTGAAEWVNTNCNGKKILVIKNYTVPDQVDIQFEAFKEALTISPAEFFELPQPKMDDEMGMPPEMMYDMGGPISKEMRKSMEAYAKDLEEALSAKVSADKYDTVVFIASVPDFLLFPKPIGVIKPFKDKQYVFLYGVNELKAKNKNILGYLSDKSLDNPDDYDKAPSGDLKKDFDMRYEFKTTAAK